MINYLISVFGKENVNIFNCDLGDLPIYMRKYEFDGIVLYGRKLLFMKPNKIDITAYNKHSKLISEKFNISTVLVLERSKEVQRNNLIKNNLMFIEKNKFIFLPYVGIIFNNKEELSKEDINELSYKDFIVSLSFIYIKKQELKVSDICMFSNTNKMTTTRALNKLVALGLIKKINNQKTYSYEISVSKDKFINTILEYMKLPIKCVRLINIIDLPNCALYAGISALSMNSMLNDDLVSTYAIEKKEYEKIEHLTKEYIEGIIIESNQVKLEVWNYNPNICSINKCAELISVIRTINEVDERVLDAIEIIKGRIVNE